MSIIKRNIFPVFVTVILKVGGFRRNNATSYTILNTYLLTRYKIGRIINYFVINVTAVKAKNSI